METFLKIVNGFSPLFFQKSTIIVVLHVIPTLTKLDSTQFFLSKSLEIPEIQEQLLLNATENLEKLSETI